MAEEIHRVLRDAATLLQTLLENADAKALLDASDAASERSARGGAATATWAAERGAAPSLRRRRPPQDQDNNDDTAAQAVENPDGAAQRRESDGCTLPGTLACLVRTGLDVMLEHGGASAGRHRLYQKLPVLQGSLASLRSVLTSALEGRRNFFGTYNARICLARLHLLEVGLLRTLEQLDPTVKAGCAGASSSANAARSAGEGAAECLIRNLEARAFWILNFGDATLIPWERFALSFVETFGPHLDPPMEKLRRQLCAEMPAWPPGCDTESVSEVDITRFDVFSRELGLYEAFQKVADPGTIVYCMGTVEDFPETEPARPAPLKGLLGVHVTQVSCGGQHATALTNDGRVYTWGRGGFGRLGHGDSRDVAQPRLVCSEPLARRRCVQVACGFAYTAAITSTGALYTWGAGENGRLGVGDDQDRYLPTLVKIVQRVKEVYAGSVHTCILTVDGVMMSCGKHEYTGHGLCEDVLWPIPLEFAFHGHTVKRISVGPGGYHTIALTTDGVYTWGHNRVGQLGYGNSSQAKRNNDGAYFIPVPQKVTCLSGVDVTDVVAGWGHSAVLTSAGEVYICGRNFQGQLGLGFPDRFPKNERGHPFQSEFVRLSTLNALRVRQVSCGGEHSVCIDEKNEVYTFGLGAQGQLGHPDTESENYPRRLDLMLQTHRHVIHAACGNNSTLLLTGPTVIRSLYQLCIEKIRKSDYLYALVESMHEAQAQEGAGHDAILEIGERMDEEASGAAVEGSALKVEIAEDISIEVAHEAPVPVLPLHVCLEVLSLDRDGRRTNRFNKAAASAQDGQTHAAALAASAPGEALG